MAEISENLRYIHIVSAPKRFAKFGWPKQTFSGEKEVSQTQVRQTIGKSLKLSELNTGELGYEGPSGTTEIGPSYAKSVICIHDRLSPSYASVYAIALGTSFERYKSQNSERIWLTGLLLYMYLSATLNTRRCE